MMQKMKAEKGDTGGTKRKYKLNSKELALLELEKKRKQEERVNEKKEQAKKAGVPESFFDSAKTKAFLNLNKAPQKSILKNSSRLAPRTADQQFKPTPSAGANAKATGKEWTSKAPELTIQPKPKEAAKEEIPSDFFDNKDEMPPKEPSAEVDGGGDELPEGFFDDPLKDAKARGVEYKNPEDQEWETFQKEIAAEVRESAELAAEEQLEETTDRQLEEIDEQMRAWSRVREAEIRKDVVEEKLQVKKEVKVEEKEESEDEMEDEDLEDFLDWRIKKLS